MKIFRIKKVQNSAEQKIDTIVVIFFFYGASERAMKKYSDLYHSFCFDVMYVPSNLKTFARPSKSRELANNVLSFLKLLGSTYDRIVIHAFSMGGFNFNVCIREMYVKPEIYSTVQKNIKAVIYDSLTIGDYQIMASGIAQGASGSKIVQTVTLSAMCTYMLLTYPWTLKYYKESIEVFKKKPLQVPTLVFTCENDQLCEYKFIQGVIKNWREKFSLPTVFHSWEKSRHTAHFLFHKDEYIHVLSDFLNSVPCLLTQVTRL